MYDDLARTQRSSVLELVALNMVIPSVVLTLATHPSPVSGGPLPRTYGDVTCAMLGAVDPPKYVPPRLAWMPELAYPAVMLQTGTEGHVVVRALIDTRGRVEPASIVVQAVHAAFADRVREALQIAEFRPASVAGQHIAAWVTFSVYFDIYVE